MPCLTQDLGWKDDVPMFVTGRLAGLRTGPDCGNLEGARVGAERIAWAVEEWMEEWKGGSEGEEEYQGLWQRVGSLNMYESLEGGEEQEGSQ